MAKKKGKSCPIKRRIKIGGTTYAAYTKSVRGGKGRKKHMRGFMRKVRNGKC